MKYKNTKLSPQERAKDLLARLSIEDKLNQMLLTTDITAYYNSVQASEDAIEYGSGYISDNVDVDIINKLQSHLINKTKWGIPLLIMGESLHGVMNPTTTVFPQSIGLASTFNEKILLSVGEVCGREASALGIKMTYAPNVDISRDPRWGRVEENYGEDPYLTSRLGVAYIKGFQSQGGGSCPKHYIAHGTPENGINLGPVHAGERELREIMLEPFEACIKEAKCMGIMPAYSELDGIPVHASDVLMKKLLRDELGFEGVTVSDFEAIQMLNSFHRVADTPLEAGRLAIAAGIDVEAPNPYGYGEEFRLAAIKGEVPVELINESVYRILTVKFRLGLFENPYAKEHLSGIINTSEAKQLARLAAEEGMVLLKNDGILPLSPEIGKIALIGPNIDFMQLGGYTHRDAYNRTPSIAEVLGEKLQDRVMSAKGCNIAFADGKELSNAINIAEKADKIILVLGDNSCFFGGVGWGDVEGNSVVTCGEGFDSSTLELPDSQIELFNSLAKLNKPIVLVLNSGRPYAIMDMFEQSSAVIQSWYIGEMGGLALYNILFGVVSPSGRLPISFPRSVGHLPCYYNHKASARGYYKVRGSKEKPGRDYVFDTPDAFLSFGHGLSYTQFEYSDLKIIASDKGYSVTIDVQNVGNMDGKEAVLLYVSPEYSPVTPFVKRLRGFKKIALKKGMLEQVTFYLTDEDFVYIDQKMQKQKNIGKHTISIANLTSSIEIK